MKWARTEKSERLNFQEPLLLRNHQPGRLLYRSFREGRSMVKFGYLANNNAARTAAMAAAGGAVDPAKYPLALAALALSEAEWVWFNGITKTQLEFGTRMARKYRKCRECEFLYPATNANCIRCGVGASAGVPNVQPSWRTASGKSSQAPLANADVSSAAGASPFVLRALKFWKTNFLFGLDEAGATFAQTKRFFIECDNAGLDLRVFAKEFRFLVSITSQAKDLGYKPQELDLTAPNARAIRAALLDLPRVTQPAASNHRGLKNSPKRKVGARGPVRSRTLVRLSQASLEVVKTKTTRSGITGSRGALPSTPDTFARERAGEQVNRNLRRFGSGLRRRG